MTLPFRRRHNDAEASHDRARALTASGFTESIEPSDAAWLAAHLVGCPECVADAAAYAADRELLRVLRDQAPEPPRDLWARTAAAIEQADARRDRGARAGRAPRGRRPGRIPIGVASGLLVVAVVVGVSLAPRGLPLHPSAPAGSDVAISTPRSEATPIAVTADALAWIQAAPDGSYEFRRATLDSVCPDVRSGCATLDNGSTTRLALSQPPQAVVQSPSGSEIVVVTSAGSVGGADVVVVPVPTAPPNPSVVPTVMPSGSANLETPPPVSTVQPTSTPADQPTATPTATPAVGPTATPATTPTGSSEPTSGHSIASGVAVVGDTAYSPDGTWLAFSARPADGSAGPDLYLWRVGDPLAVAVTADHRTFFAGWLGNKVLANVVVPTIPVGVPLGAALQGPSGSPEPAATSGPGATPEASAPIVEEHPIAITLDPETGATMVVAAQDMWRPTVDPTGRSVVYWAGTLVADATGTGWVLGTGQLVIDGWVGLTEDPTDGPPPPPHPTAPGNPVALQPGPAGHPVALSDGPGVAFDAWFDPSGLRLAVWIADPTDPAVGTLRLIVLDPETLDIDPTVDPLPGVAALRGVSINEGRLAWVTPPGQDGEGSHVQVLGWHGLAFGQVRTIQAERLFVVR